MKLNVYVHVHGYYSVLMHTTGCELNKQQKLNICQLQWWVCVFPEYEACSIFVSVITHSNEHSRSSNSTSRSRIFWHFKELGIKPLIFQMLTSSPSNEPWQPLDTLQTWNDLDSCSSFGFTVLYFMLFFEHQLPLDGSEMIRFKSAHFSISVSSGVLQRTTLGPLPLFLCMLWRQGEGFPNDVESVDIWKQKTGKAQTAGSSLTCSPPSRNPIPCWWLVVCLQVFGRLHRSCM